MAIPIPSNLPANPIVDFHDLTSDWLNEAVFDVFKRDTIKSIYENSKI